MRVGRAGPSPPSFVQGPGDGHWVGSVQMSYIFGPYVGMDIMGTLWPSAEAAYAAPHDVLGNVYDGTTEEFRNGK